MAITSTSQIARIRIIIESFLAFEVRTITVRDASNLSLARWTPPVDTDSTEWNYAYNKYTEDGFLAEYAIDGTTYHGYDAVPENLQALVDTACPFRRQQLREQSAPQVDTSDTVFPPAFYYRRVVGDAPTAPDLSTYNGDDITVESLMTAAGWSVNPPAEDGDTATADILYVCRVHASRTDEVYDAVGYVGSHTDTRWMVNGETGWTTTPPDDDDTIDAIEMLTASGWRAWPTAPRDVINPYVLLNGSNFQNTGADTQQVINMEGEALLADNWAVGVWGSRFTSWSASSTYNYSGKAHITVEEIKEALASPADYAARETAEDRVSRKTFGVFIHNWRGSVDFNLIDTDRTLGEMAFANESAWQIVFVSYPHTTLSTFLGATATFVDTASSADLEVGDTLFVEDEQMRITGITGSSCYATRGINGTTAVSHDAGTAVRAVVNHAEVRKIVITRRESHSWQTKMRLFRLRKRGAE